MHQEELERMALKACDTLAEKMPGDRVVIVFVGEPGEIVRYGLAFRGDKLQVLGLLALGTYRIEKMIVGH